MGIKLGKAAAALLAAMVVLLGLQSPAGALPAGAAAVHAISSIEPRLGLTYPAASSTITFGAGAVGTINGTPGTCGLTANLSGTTRFLSGSGSASLACNGAGAFTCTGTFNLSFNILGIHGTCSGGFNGSVFVEAALTPTAASVTTFAVSGVLTSVPTNTYLQFNATGTFTPSPAPALEHTARAVTQSIGGTAAGVFGTTPGICNIGISGTGFDSLVAGNGNGTGKCLGSGININCPSVSWTRVGTVLLITGSCTGTAAGTLAMTGHLTPMEGATNVMFFDGALAIA